MKGIYQVLINSTVSVFPLLLKNKQASNTVQFPNLINVLNGDPARVGIAVGSGVDGAL